MSLADALLIGLLILSLVSTYILWCIWAALDEKGASPSPPIASK